MDTEGDSGSVIIVKDLEQCELYRWVRGSENTALREDG